LDVKQAAEVLGISSEGVRKRIKRGKLESEKDVDGKVYVWLDEDRTSTDDDWTAGREDESGMVEVLREQVELLRTELEDWKSIVAARDRELETRAEELRRKDHIIMSLTQRIPELEPARESSSEQPESPVTASEEEGKGHVPPEPENAKSESWWRRIFR
jgi:hypothetical protein